MAALERVLQVPLRVGGTTTRPQIFLDRPDLANASGSMLKSAPIISCSELSDCDSQCAPMEAASSRFVLLSPCPLWKYAAYPINGRLAGGSTTAATA